MTAGWSSTGTIPASRPVRISALAIGCLGRRRPGNSKVLLACSRLIFPPPSRKSTKLPEWSRPVWSPLMAILPLTGSQRIGRTAASRLAQSPPLYSAQSEREEFVLLCASCDRSCRSACPELAPGLTPDSISKNILRPSCRRRLSPVACSFWGKEKGSHTVWVTSVTLAPSRNLPVCPYQLTWIGAASTGEMGHLQTRALEQNSPIRPTRRCERAARVAYGEMPSALAVRAACCVPPA